MPELNVREAIKDLLSNGHWYTANEIVGYLLITHKKLLADAAITARIRDLRKPQFGGHKVPSRPRQGSTAWEYRRLS